MRRPQRKRTSEVFGLSNEVLPDSYVDRGDLDEAFGRLLGRPTHIALRGESKCGKSWLRQQNLPDALVIQCRLGKSVTDIYRDALAELGVRLEVESVSGSKLVGRVEASAEGGIRLLAKVGVKATGEAETAGSTTSKPVGQDITDLRFVADLIRASGQRLVIEDFHYLSVAERRAFSFDLKALWDFGLFVIVVGVWSEQNMLMYLNPDLTGRVQELSIVWNENDLRRIFEKGGAALRLSFLDDLQQQAVSDCFENAGILQALILGTLDEMGIQEGADKPTLISDTQALETAAMTYADQLNPLYQQFAKRVAGGIRKRKDSTGIYAHAMAVILETPDETILRGVSLDQIHEAAHSRESRIQKGNLRTVLEKIESLQVDEDGRGLVVAYNEATGEVSVVDRQLLLYRKYSTVKWPWEDLIREAEKDGSFS